MKCKLAFIFILLFSINMYAQRSVLESEEATDEQKRIQKIAAEIGKLGTDYAKSKTQHEKNISSLNTFSFSLNGDKYNLLQRKKDIQAALYSIQENSLKEKAKQIDILSSSIGHKYSYSDALQRRIDKLNENLKKINNHLNGLENKKIEERVKEEEEELKYKVKIGDLDKEISSLDAMLANSKTTTPKKSKSLDDFLTEKGKTSNSKTNSGNSLDAMLSSSSNKTTSKSNSLDAMLSSGSKNSKDNSLDNLITDSSNDTDFEIDQKNGLTGVINNRGKILIPYKEWKIIEYKMGIAKVSINIDSQSSSCGSVYLNKEGFVDTKGEFIDGYDYQTVTYATAFYSGLYLIAVRDGETLTDADRERIDNRRKKETQIKQKKCQLELQSIENNMKSRYR